MTGHGTGTRTWRWRRLAVLLGVGTLLVGCAHATGRDGGDVGVRLTVDVPDEDLDADLFIDGHYVGQIREVQGEVRLAPGRHRLEVKKPGRFPIQRTLEVARSPREQTRVVQGELLPDPRMP